MTLEEDLRVTLHDRAAAARPPAADLLTEVTSGVRRDVRRRRLTAGGAGVAVVVAALAVPLMRHDADPPRPQPLPAASPSLPVGWERSMWAPAPFFPLRPTWVPADLGTRPEVLQMGPNEVLRYERNGDVLTAEIGVVDPAWDAETTGEHATEVNGVPATVRTAGAGPGDRYVSVRWQMPEVGGWVQVTSRGRHTEAEVLRFARGLDGGMGSMAGTSLAPFVFGVLPVRVSTQYQSPDQVCLTDRDVTRRREPDGLCVLVADEPFVGGGERVTVAGRAASLRLDSGSLVIDLGGRVLTVTWDPGRFPLSRDEVLAFAGGITYRR
ncbi:hypothetical protein Aph02nite_09030 [Actinoplanes philippinensis]|uniref:Uncharacterized protein n=1 Tax=Actinoplanes philippinensis TaxID=35752 RepID=A0A1I2ACC3_9ACTN|nr:hypothetical protein [Actinoplanes philippinensis]GIE74953.1 hypothetical protein Aph02nite_09030 [Actinoplanes philippinensis]SFE41674.1 hypothetical protein SAMN05421541_101638 [Actinoplanes philippinensis]